ncbi:unnamed protein product [Choristocarpus tenellus]
MLNCYTPRRVKPDDAKGAGDGKYGKENVEAKVLPTVALVNGKRGDGRGPFDIRQVVYMDVGVIAHTTGSAYVEFNHTKVERA